MCPVEGGRGKDRPGKRVKEEKVNERDVYFTHCAQSNYFYWSEIN
jgi:hypothetical protein